MKKYFYFLKKEGVKTFLSIALLLSVIFFVEYTYDKLFPHVWYENSTQTQSVLPEETLPYISFGFRNVIADYYWIQVIQDFALKGKSQALYRDYYYNITTLDKQFSYPYIFGTFVFANKKSVASVDFIAPLVERGIKNLPNNWEIPYYLGFEYNLTKKAYDKATHYLSIAASTPSAPKHIMTTYNNYVDNLLKGKDGKAVTDDLVRVILESSSNKSLKDLAKKEIVLNRFTSNFETAITEYKKKYQKYPNSLDDLLKAVSIPLPQDFYEKIAVQYDNKTGEVVLSFKG